MSPRDFRTRFRQPRKRRRRSQKKNPSMKKSRSRLNRKKSQSTSPSQKKMTMMRRRTRLRKQVFSQITRPSSLRRSQHRRRKERESARRPTQKRLRKSGHRRNWMKSRRVGRHQGPCLPSVDQMRTFLSRCRYLSTLLNSRRKLRTQTTLTGQSLIHSRLLVRPITKKVRRALPG